GEARPENFGFRGKTNEPEERFQELRSSDSFNLTRFIIENSIRSDWWCSRPVLGCQYHHYGRSNNFCGIMDLAQDLSQQDEELSKCKHNV
ncbi:hypothetical protein AVEN_264659-1, partial [Araneus ventricosus]